MTNTYALDPREALNYPGQDSVDRAYDLIERAQDWTAEKLTSLHDVLDSELFPNVLFAKGGPGSGCGAKAKTHRGDWIPKKGQNSNNNRKNKAHAARGKRKAKEAERRNRKQHQADNGTPSREIKSAYY